MDPTGPAQPEETPPSSEKVRKKTAYRPGAEDNREDACFRPTVERTDFPVAGHRAEGDLLTAGRYDLVESSLRIQLRGFDSANSIESERRGAFATRLSRRQHT